MVRKILLVFAVVLLLRLFVFEAFFVSGESMYPTLRSGDYVFVNKLAYLWSEPQRGDIVVAKARSGERLIKRVAAVPYEWFDIEGRKQNVDPNEAYLIGDNREVSIDSRVLGAVDDWDITGRVFGAISFERKKYIGF